MSQESETDPTKYFEKELMRGQAREHRRLTDVRHEDIEAATPLFFDELAPTADKVIAAYWPTEREFDPTHILETAHKNGHICALPRVANKTRVLEFIKWTPETKMEKGKYGIMQPAEGEAVSPDIFLVPMLSFDRAGYRLGQGGGYYDATLAHYRKNKDILAVGIAYALQAVLFTLPREEHDQRMDYILTPQGITSYI